MAAMTVTAVDLGWSGQRTRALREAPALRGHLRLTARGRAVLVAGALVLGGAWTLAGPVAHAGDGQPAVPVTAVTVAQGQTLWQIARSVAAPNQDVRDVVDELVVLNGLDGVALQAGQQLLVPVPDGR